MKGNRYWKPNLPEIHIAILGANGSGKSALTVKYMTKRFIGEYDPQLEDTYCKRDNVNGREYMVWIMDTVEGDGKDPNRYLGWADIFIVLYSVTDRPTFEYAEQLLNVIKNHEHSACRREHVVVLVGNQSDMERYRQISKSKGTTLAAEFSAEFYETNCTEEYAVVRPIFHQAIEISQSSRRSCPASLTGNISSQSWSSSEPRITTKPPLNPNITSSSDSEKSHHHSPNPFQRRSRTKSPNDSNKSSNHEKSNSLPSPKKASQGLKWFKRFQS